MSRISSTNISQPKPKRQRDSSPSILVWSGRPSGPDPTTHFWFDQAGTRLRICDNVAWSEWPEYDASGPVAYVPCRLCKELYLEDVMYGRHVLDVLPEPPAPDENGHPPLFEVYSPYNRGYTKESQYTPKEQGDAMPTIPIASFARFYEARPASQPRIVRDIRIQQSDPDSYRKRYYYHDLRNILSQTHWQTNDIEVFEAALEPFLADQKDDQKKEHFRQIGDAYIRYWKSRNARLFEVAPVEVDIAGLTICVRPEVGMRTDDGDDLVLKLWFNSPRLTRQYRQAIKYLMEQARTEAEWPDSWQPYLWDVRRENIPPPVTVTADSILGIRGQAAAFLGIWNQIAEGF